MSPISVISFPSLIEAYSTPLRGVANQIQDGLQLFEENQGYVVGNLALEQGISPYRNINSSPTELDYQLLSKAGILIGSDGKGGEYTITTGFPFVTYDLFKQEVQNFLTPKDIFIDFNPGTFSNAERKKNQYSIKRLDIMPEILGSVTAIRKGPIEDHNNFFIVSLGYGTCEVALSAESGLLSRTCISAIGLRSAVNSLYQELSKVQNLGLKNEHQMNQSFQTGRISVGRVKKDLTELRKKYLINYYKDIISPTIRKAFTDNDYEKSSTLYIVGGGALYPEIISCFQDEFSTFLDVIVPENPSNLASLGYYLNSCLWSNDIKMAIGLDIGNAYTVVTKTASSPENSI